MANPRAECGGLFMQGGGKQREADLYLLCTPTCRQDFFSHPLWTTRSGTPEHDVKSLKKKIISSLQPLKSKQEWGEKAAHRALWQGILTRLVIYSSSAISHPRRKLSLTTDLNHSNSFLSLSPPLTEVWQCPGSRLRPFTRFPLALISREITIILPAFSTGSTFKSENQFRESPPNVFQVPHCSADFMSELDKSWTNP